MPDQIGTYRVRVVKGPIKMRQRWHIRIENVENGNILLWSEKYKHKGFVVALADDLAAALFAELIVEE